MSAKDQPADSDPNRILLDGRQVQVRERLEFSEPGRYGEKWTILVIGQRGKMRRLIEEQGSKRYLYKKSSLRDVGEAIEWTYNHSDISRESSKQVEEDVVEYRRGRASDGTRVLNIDNAFWELVAPLVGYGPDEKWLASAHFPARQLRQYEIEPDLSSGRHRFGWTVFCGLLLWAVGDAYFGGLAFMWGFWILGILGVLFSSLVPASPPRLAISAAFGLWLMAYPLLLGLAEHWPLGLVERLSAVATLLAFLVLSRLSHLPFYVLGDGTIRAVAISVVLYTVGLAGVAFIDEDAAWMFEWLSIFIDSPYIYCWWGMWALCTVHIALDYRRVPLSAKAFDRLRRELVQQLRSDDPLIDAKLIGGQFDDLGDAIHLARRPEVRRLSPYMGSLYRAARVMRGLPGAGLASMVDCADTWERIKDDLRVLAEDLETLEDREKLGTQSTALRLSPSLRAVVEYKDDNR